MYILYDGIPLRFLFLFIFAHTSSLYPSRANKIVLLIARKAKHRKYTNNKLFIVIWIGYFCQFVEWQFAYTNTMKRVTHLYIRNISYLIKCRDVFSLYLCNAESMWKKKKKTLGEIRKVNWVIRARFNMSTFLSDSPTSYLHVLYDLITLREKVLKIVGIVRQISDYTYDAANLRKYFLDSLTTLMYSWWYTYFQL